MIPFRFIKNILYVVSLFFVFFNTSAKAQTYTGDVKLTSQAEINTFGANNFTSISGNLIIQDISGDITDLTPLSSITSVGGSFDVAEHSLLTNLNGLNNITNVGGNFTVISNSLITSLDELSNIASVGGYIEVINNNLLTNIDGLSKITHVSKYLMINDNSSLTNLKGLKSITSIDWDLVLQSNPKLTNVDGLRNLTSLGGHLFIVSNSSLTNLNGLSGITSVKNDIIIQGNSALTNVDGLVNITTFNSSIAIGDNEVLNNINGLKNIKSVINIEIGLNPLLVNLDALTNLKSASALIISNNSSLTNLDGLIGLTSFVNGIGIILYQNVSLKSILGLKNITSALGINIFGNSSLKNLDGLDNIISVDQNFLDISNNISLENVDGLKNLKSARTLMITNNPKLANLDGLANLTYIGSSLRIKNNISLTSFCGLFPLFDKGIVVDFYDISGNLVNPTKQQILANGPCIPPYKISYEIVLPNCNDPHNPLVIEKGSFFEGQSCVFPSYTLPSPFSNYQPFYNSIVGTEFGIPLGSLNEDINISINLSEICDEAQVKNLDTQGIIELFFLSIEINGSVSGSHNPLEYYYFNNGKEAYIKIPIVNITTLLDLLNFKIDQLTPFFTVNGLNPDFDGIRKEVDENYFTIYAKHFSEVRLGIIISPTDVNKTNSIQTEYELRQNYPNPFNPSTVISYSIPKSSYVSLTIYDVLGNTISVLENGNKSAGAYSYNFNSSKLTSGIYFYTLKAGNYTNTKKMLLVK